MSRSVRTRRLTVYDGHSAGVTPSWESDKVPARTTSTYPSRPPQPDASSSRQPQGTQTANEASGRPAGRARAGTLVGSNLKKRLSTRHGDDQRGGAAADSAIPAVPDLPSDVSQQAYVQSAYAQLVEGGAGPASRRRLPVLGGASEGHDYDGRTPSGHTIDDRSGDGDGRLPGASGPGQRGGSTDADQHLRGLVPAIKTTSSSPHRQPAGLAWQGSSLKSVLDSTRRYSHSDHLIDLDKLRQQDHFSPTDYLRLHLPPNMSPAKFSETLTAAKAAVKEDVKSQVFANYTDFIAISSQVGALENEMIELKALLGEWRGMPRVLESHEESSNSLLGSSTVNTLARRSSLLSLQQVYRAQLTALWEGIDNSQKFIPYKPGRHLIAEAPDFVELNAATYRPINNVALFLLDDLLLVASRKKGRMTTKVRLEAQRCFALGEIVVVDLKDSAIKAGASDNGSTSVSGSIKDSIKIKKGKETFVYRAERSESKKALLNAFRRVAEELANRKKKQGGAGVDGAQEGGRSMVNRRASVYSGMGVNKLGVGSASKSVLGDMAQEGGEEDGVMKLASEKVKEERKDPHRWLNDWSDGLAVDIALRRWKEACEKVSKGKAVLSTYTPTDAIHQVLTSRLNAHIGSLVSSLLSSLQSPSLRKTSLISISSALNSLGYSSIARQTFLNAREDLLRKRKRSIKFEGDTELYVAELSMVVFGMVRNTSEWFMVSWKETGMASGFVRWALSQIHSFALTFRRQVYGNVNIGSGKYDKETAARAQAVALESAQQLKDVGLDFGFVLNELLRSEEEQMALNLARFRELPANTLILDGNAVFTESPTSAGSSEAPTTSVSGAGEGPPVSSARRTDRVLDRAADGEGYSPAPTTTRRRAVDLSAGSSSTVTAGRSSGVRSLRQDSSQTLPIPLPMPIPSLTLTLADEASGISHRISSADLPNVTAQEIRRNSVMMMHHGRGNEGGSPMAAQTRRMATAPAPATTTMPMTSSRGGLDSVAE